VKAIDPEGASRSREEYVARLYGAFCDAAGRLDPARGTLVEYGSLPGAAWETVVPHFGLAVDGAARARMREAAGMNSKAPVGRPEKFAGDAADNEATASDELRSAIEVRPAGPEPAQCPRHAGEHA
jgi:hypothetical protein